MVYLIHFHQKIAHAQHYIGFTDDLDTRIKRHGRCGGSRLLRAAKQRGIKFEVVRTWEGDREVERMLKNKKSSPKLCPICNGGKAQ